MNLRKLPGKGHFPIPEDSEDVSKGFFDSVGRLIEDEGFPGLGPFGKEFSPLARLAGEKPFEPKGVGWKPGNA